MTYEPLHHKYRPQSFAQLVGQEAIATTLSNALRQQRIAPAYLFTGPRGTGKTSSARILAKSLNCISSTAPTAQPCGTCETCLTIARGNALDVIEIDAASNTGVDNIRELIERAQFAPVQCRYKVYVIDECHMLSVAAFNALLKTLEEPPDRVVFVLATTDPQKVLPTIISRCQKFDFRRIPLEAMVQHLKAIAAQEQINIAPDAIQLVAQISQGGLRDAESLLDQLSLLEGEIGADRVWDLVGAVPERDLLALVQSIATNDAVGVLDGARRLMDRGREPLIVLQNLASFYRDLLIAKTSPQRHDLVAITPSTWKELCEFVQTWDLPTLLKGQQHLRSSEAQIKNTTQPRLWLEVTLMGLLPANLNLSAAAPVRSPVQPIAQPVSQPVAQPVAQPITQPVSQPVSQTAPPRQPVEQPAQPISPLSAASNGRSVEPPVAVPEEPQSAGVQPQIERATPAPEPETFRELDAEQIAPTRSLAEAAVPEPETDNPPQAAAPAMSADPADLLQELSETAAPAAQYDLEQLWQQILQLVQPLSTQIMFRQQCLLLAFDGQEACIGAKSQKLLKMAQARMPSMEAAFAKRFGYAIPVMLQVVPATAEAALPSAVSEAPAVPPPASYSTRPTLRETAPPFPSPQSSPAQPDFVPPAGVPELAPDPAPIAPLWQEEDEVRRAAKSLAQMFNGQLVSLEAELVHRPAGDMALDIALAPTESSLDEVEPAEDDVPF